MGVCPVACCVIKQRLLIGQGKNVPDLDLCIVAFEDQYAVRLEYAEALREALAQVLLPVDAQIPYFARSQLV